MNNLPERIFLQIGEEVTANDICDFNELVGVSWANENIFNSDVEYIRKDVAEEMAKEFALFAVQNAKRGTENECEELFTEFLNSKAHDF